MRNVSSNNGIIFSFVDKICFIFCTFLWAFLKCETVLSVASEFPMLSNGVTVFPRWILSSIILCAFSFSLDNQKCLIFCYFYFYLFYFIFFFHIPSFFCFFVFTFFAFNSFFLFNFWTAWIWIWFVSSFIFIVSCFFWLFLLLLLLMLFLLLLFLLFNYFP